MKLHKKICSIVCTSIILLITLNPLQVFANGVSVNDLDFDDSITEEQKKGLDPMLIRVLSEEEGEILSIQTVTIPFKEFNPLTRVMATYNFSMDVVAQRINEKPGMDNFRFIATGHWKDNPAFEFTDCIALAWSDEFTLYDDTCYTLDTYNGVKHEWCTDRNSVSPEAGVAYDVDLIVGDRQEYVVLEAKVYKADESGSANVVCSYGHVTLAAQSIDVGFSAGKEGPSIAMSASVGFNLEMGSPDYTSFDY